MEIETRIGELVAKEPKALSKRDHKGKFGAAPSGKPPKHERLGMKRKQMLKEPICWTKKCRHYIGVIQPDGTEQTETNSCKVYPNGIPLKIANGKILCLVYTKKPLRCT